MNDKNIIYAALEEFCKTGIKMDSHEIIREKDGIVLIKIKSGGNSYVFKYFDNAEYRREIKIYKILKSLDVETVKVIASNEKSILMEDINESETLRLGTEEDMSDPTVAKALAKWYKKLHSAGYGYIKTYGDDFYYENSVITKENLAFVKKKTKTSKLPVWKNIEDNFEKIESAIKNEKYTFNYNDFYYTNLIVAKDKSKAFMFDYNLFGKGAAVSDINNVCWSLSDEAAKTFREEYGEIDAKETVIEEVASVLSSLYFACEREEFPDWGTELLEQLENGFDKKLKALTEL